MTVLYVVGAYINLAILNKNGNVPQFLNSSGKSGHIYMHNIICTLHCERYQEIQQLHTLETQTSFIISKS